jgi:hypothetical protein
VRVRRWLEWLVPVLIWTIAACYMYSRFLAHPTRGVPGGPDGILYVWYFESVQHSLAHLANPFISPGMNAPTGVNLMWNTSLIGLALLCAPLTATIGPIATVGLLMVASPILSASAAYWALRRLTRRTVASAVAASLYGFGPFFVGQSGHLHLIAAAPFLPLLLVAGHRLLIRQPGNPVRSGLWLGLLIGCALLVSEEVVAMAAIVSVIAVLALAVLYPRRMPSHLRYAAAGLGVAVATALVIAGVPLWYQFYGPLALHSGVTLTNLPLDLAGVVRPSLLFYYASKSDVLANRHFRANPAENTGYLGWPLLILMLGILVLLAIHRDRFAYWWVLCAGMTFWLSLGPYVWVNGHETSVAAPWVILHDVPVVRSVVTVRFTLLITLLVALLLAWGLSRLADWRLYLAALVVVVLALVPLRPAGRYDQIQMVPTPRFFATSAINMIKPGSNVFVLPQGHNPGVASTVMYWQIKAHMRFNIIGGYSVFNQNGESTYRGQMPPYTTVLLNAALGKLPTALDVWNAQPTIGPSKVRYIVITKYIPNVDYAASTAQALTGCTPQHVADVVVCTVPDRLPPRA